MNFIVNINVCRVCMKAELGESLLENVDLQSKFVFTTQLKFIENDNMPKIICSKCIVRLKVAYDFLKLSHATEKNLKKFLTKISNDFEMVTKSTSASDDSPPSTSNTTDANAATLEDDVLLLVLEGEEDTTTQQQQRQQSQEQVNDEELCIKQKSSIAYENEGKQNKPKTEFSVKEEQADCYLDENTAVVAADGGDDDDDDDDDTSYVVYEEENYINERDAYNNDDKNEKLQTDKDVTDKISYVETMTIKEIYEVSDEGETKAQIEMLDSLQQSEDSQTRESLHEPAVVNNNYLKEYEAMLEVNAANVDYVDENSAEEMHIYDDAEDLLEQQGRNIETAVVTESYKMDEDISQENVDTQSYKEHFMLDDTESSKSKARKTAAKRSRKSPTSTSVSSIAARTHYVCVKCNRDFSTKTNLTRHMALHEGKRPFQCSICQKGFTQNGSLKQHMYTHTKEKPYVCEVCSRGFTQCKSLIFHMRRHTGDKPFPCEKCGLLFRQKDGLKTHILKHHMITEQSGDVATHTCVICKKVLASKYALMVHMKKHVNNHKSANEVPNSSGNENSNTDSLLHLIDEDDGDGSGFLNDRNSFVNDDLALNIDESTHVVDVMATSAAAPSRAKKFQCRKCFKCFAIKKNLIRHLSIHDVPVSEMFQCRICEIAFDTNYALNTHRVREHKDMEIDLTECDEQLEFDNVDELAPGDHQIDIPHELHCPECPNLSFRSQKLLMEHMLEHELNDVREDV